MGVPKKECIDEADGKKCEIGKIKKAVRIWLFVEPKAGLEPATYSLRMSYSTN